MFKLKYVNHAWRFVAHQARMLKEQYQVASLCRCGNWLLLHPLTTSSNAFTAHPLAALQSVSAM